MTRTMDLLVRRTKRRRPRPAGKPIVRNNLAMPDTIEITPSGPINARIRPPGSKSITNRALVCAALAAGASRLAGVLDSDDTRVMLESLRRLGFEIEFDSSTATVTITGRGGAIPAKSAELFVGNSGTTIRFLTPVATLGQGVYRLDGVRRMHERPIRDLLDALAQLGADATSEFGNGCPPVVVNASGLPGGVAHVSGTISSQYLSGLLMAAVGARADVELVVDGELVSQPYVRMTLAVMRAFGCLVDYGQGLSRFHIPADATFKACDYAIEPDASAASYFWAAAAITGGTVTVEGLGKNALQGDVAFCDCLGKMGCRVEYGDSEISVTGGPLYGIEVDMNGISDTVQTLAAVALFANGPTTVTHVGHIRHKETDRIGDLARELRKFGATVTERDDGLTIEPNEVKPAQVATYDDHRMAMSLALVGLKTPGVVIEDPACTGKTYPKFWNDLNGINHPTG
jgi:3-phosphoshikimate 1-carboxyvinyltransferase